MPEWMIKLGDCVEIMRTMKAGCADAIVTDPPYGLGFMGKEWDKPGRAARATTTSIEGQRGNPFARTCAEFGGASYGGSFLEAQRGFHEWSIAWAREALRVLKPGGHLLAFGGTRTYHRLACAIEDAGFEIRDALDWLYGQGFPKSHDVSKAIDKHLGAEREVIGENPNCRPNMVRVDAAVLNPRVDAPLTLPATDDAKRWAGWGTALKPAHEPIVLARKSLTGTVAENVLAHGTGGINIDGSRVGTTGGSTLPSGMDRLNASNAAQGYRPGAYQRGEPPPPEAAGRWPPNVLLTHAPDCRQVGTRKARRMVETGPVPDRDAASVACYGEGINGRSTSATEEEVAAFECAPGCPVAALDAQSESVSRFFPTLTWDDHDFDLFRYAAKAGTRERGGKWNNHPTVKPIALMRWLCKLVTPPGGIILDPFAGSGTTLIAAMAEGFHVLGIEREADYVEIVQRRLAER